MNNIFKNIFCINLDFRKDRWELSNNFFEENNISCTRWEATKGEDAALASTLSHVNLIKFAKDNKMENIFIFEDDFHFINYDLNLIENAYSQLPNDWDVFYLGYNPTEPLIRYSENLYRIYGAWTTHAYAVNSRFYDKILNNFTVRADIILKNLQKTNNFYGINPCICIQRNDWSDIDKQFNPNGDSILNGIKTWS